MPTKPWCIEIGALKWVTKASALSPQRRRCFHERKMKTGVLISSQPFPGECLSRAVQTFRRGDVESLSKTFLPLSKSGRIRINAAQTSRLLRANGTIIRASQDTAT